MARVWRVALAAAVAAVASPAASAHEIPVGKPTGFVATVSSVRPNVVGLQARIVLGDQLQITNLSRSPVVILDRGGQPFRRIPTGKSDAWHDARIVATGDPPPPAQGADPSAPRFVKDWRVPGRAGRRSFAIEGFLGWVPADDSAATARGDDGPPLWALTLGAAALAALSAGALLVLNRRTD